MIRVSNNIPMEKIDTSKYEAEKPEGNFLFLSFFFFFENYFILLN